MWLRITAVLILTTGLLTAAKPATLGLVMRKGAPYASEIRDRFETETALGVEKSLPDGNWVLAWRDEAMSSPSESFDRLIVVAFKGDCTTRMPRSQAASGPLGWTSTSEGLVQPFISIDCDRVKTALMGSDGWPHSIIPAGLLGRALNHVAVHEIHHVLSARKNHDADGLFKARYSSADLLEPAIARRRIPTQISGEPSRH